MTDAHIPDTKDLLLRLGYKEPGTEAILHELDILLKEIGFDNIERSAKASIEVKDTAGLISTLKDLMFSLENRGYYRPDAPTKLIRLLVNGLDIRNEDIFALLELSGIPEEEKRKEQEFLASCAAITQLGYIFLSRLVSGVNAASSGPHIFLVIDGFSHNSMVFVDFSIDSIKEVDARLFSRNGGYYSLKTPLSGLDDETGGLLTEYYSFFHVTSGIGLGHNIHNNLGIAYDMIGRYAEAVEEFREALRLAPEYPEAHCAAGLAYYNLGSYERAIQALVRAACLDRDMLELVPDRLMLKVRQGVSRSSGRL